MDETDEQDRDDFIADRMYEETVARAAALGREHGEAGASWVFDGNTDHAVFVRCVELDDEGDPMWDELFGPGAGPLSGEWADGLTPDQLFREVAGRHAADVDVDMVDELADAYEQAYYDAWRDEVLRIARYQVDA